VARAILFAALILGLAWGVQSARAADVFVQLFPLSGEIQLRNKDASALVFDFYSIHSDGATLNSSPAVWQSISDTYDASGNGFIDATHNWTQISPSVIELTEGVFIGPGGTLAANRAISLGNIWNSVPPRDIVVEMQSNDQPLNVTLEYAIAGDYLRDGVVDQLDYNAWWQSFGSSTSLDADGNLNGIVDAADFAVWRNNLGASIPSLTIAPSTGSGSGAVLVVGAAVPEPTTAALLIAALLSIAHARGRLAARGGARRRAARR
jgi:hypothetical protein